MPDKVIAVFECQSNVSEQVVMEATNDSEKYPTFVESTCGRIELGLWSESGREVLPFFEEGANYRVTFEKIEE